MEAVAREPLKFLTQPCFPADVVIKPAVFVIGNPKTGKSTLAKAIAAKLSLVRVKLSSIIEEYIEDHKNVHAVKALQVLRSGGALSN